MPIKPPESQDEPSGFDPGQASPPIRFGVFGDSQVGPGLLGSSGKAAGGVDGGIESGAGVLGVNTAVRGIGVHGTCRQGTGVVGKGGGSFPGVLGFSETGPGVTGSSSEGTGVKGVSDADDAGVSGTSARGVGVAGESGGSESGLSGRSAQGVGVDGTGGPNGAGVVGAGTNASGVFGQSVKGSGVAGSSVQGVGVEGRGGPTAAGVSGTASGGPGVSGSSTQGPGVAGTSSQGPGVTGRGDHTVGVSGICDEGVGVKADSAMGTAVSATAGTGTGVSATAGTGIAVTATSTTGTGVNAVSSSGTGMIAKSTSSTGISASSFDGIGIIGSAGHSESGGFGFGFLPNRAPGVLGTSFFGAGVDGFSAEATGVIASGDIGLSASGRTAGADIRGDLRLTGRLVNMGAATFEVDHPLSPADRTLSHAFVASSEMKNVYDGVITLDDAGRATVRMPDWFDALNTAFRYQLTAVGAPAPGLYVSRKLSGNSFEIAGGDPGLEVSWMVTGVRADAWARANPVAGEAEKVPEERGFFLHPEAHGQAPELGIAAVRHPDHPASTEEG
ncbi:hypothetical protein [Kitasatospora sp. NPDC050543]|uniref:hypothetical protein n=1 Tax=Kitasatospora sp. NPDC050543 TaxID=3364054 RepID=UPI00378E71A7